jgi:hypothetical protein
MPGEVELPDVVYHYTTMDAMMKITETKSIFATSVRYLNDVSERDHFMDQIRKRIPAYKAIHQIPDLTIFDTITSGVEVYNTDFTDQPSVSSFSREGDSLSQWRSYCAAGNGVSIGFKTACLERAFVPEFKVEKPSTWDSAPNTSFRAVEYLSKDDPRFLDDTISLAIASTKLYFDNPDNIEDRAGITPDVYFYSTINQMACFVKDKSFSNENEVRLLVDAVYFRTQYLEFRPARSTIVPFVRVLIPEKPSETAGDQDSPRSKMDRVTQRLHFIDRVIVGPNANKNLACEAIRSYFGTKGMRVEVTPSDVPFRDL